MLVIVHVASISLLLSHTTHLQQWAFQMIKSAPYALLIGAYDRFVALTTFERILCHFVYNYPIEHTLLLPPYHFQNQPSAQDGLHSLTIVAEIFLPLLFHETNVILPFSAGARHESPAGRCYLRSIRKLAANC